MIYGTVVCNLGKKGWVLNFGLREMEDYHQC
jgi:hypothetical protein